MTHDSDPLANPIWHALNGPHRALGSVGSLAGFYDPGITPFGALKEATSEAFAQLAELAGPERRLAAAAMWASGRRKPVRWSR